jgi:AcrR family transcriptional regulator
MDILALKAECLFELGRHDAAAALINKHMSWPGIEKHVPTLTAYSYFAKKYDKVEEALRGLLKAVVADSKNKRVRKLLADILNSDMGYAELLNQLAPRKYLSIS